VGALQTPAGRFAVKEFPYDRPEQAATLAEAAEFEYSLWRAGRLLLPEPVRAPDGRLILRLAGSAGTEVTLRVHRWLAGSAVPVPPPAETAAAAGVALAQIQHAGLSLGTLRAGTLRWWSEDPRSVLRRMRDSGLLTAGEAENGQLSLDDAMSVTDGGDRLPGAWVWSHNDHKRTTRCTSAPVTSRFWTGMVAGTPIRGWRR
jgi:Ser/Thr protein kinase RdoA (MazF antagonist)